MKRPTIAPVPPVLRDVIRAIETTRDVTLAKTGV